MIILDTNVVSEPLKPAPNPKVMTWLNAQEPQTLYLSTVSLAELLSGVALLPQGRRRDGLEEALATQITTLFAGRVLDLDTLAAQTFAKTQAGARAHGNTISFADCAIAAIAQAHGFAVATRNLRDFKGTGIALIDPWV
jgi:toxin FitB